MTETINGLIAQYGLIAVFLGCLGEGETAAVLAGFFAHQRVIAPASAFLAAAGGAFCGDVLFFAAGRFFSAHPRIVALRQSPAFGRAMRLIDSHPDLFVLGNRYLYGLRLAGGVAAGLSSITVPRFLVLNLVASLVWAVLFMACGYFLGLGAEALLRSELHKHERLIAALAIAVVSIGLGWLIHRRMRARS